jgi:hypothetical protein
MALNTGINSLDVGAPEIKYTGTEGPQDPRMASVYLGDKYMGMQDLVEEFKQRNGFDPMLDIDLWKKFLDMKRQDPEARLQRDQLMASDPGMGEGPFMLDEFLEAVKNGYKGTYDQFIDEIDRRPGDYGQAPGAEGVMRAAQGGRIGFANGGTYTQRRRNQMAYGGIAGLDGRMKYGIGSWIQEKIMDPIKGTADKLIPNELKENPLLAAALIGGTTKLPIPGVEGWLGKGLETLGTKFPAIEGITDVMQTTGTGITDLINKIPGVNLPGGTMTPPTFPNRGSWPAGYELPKELRDLPSETLNKVLELAGVNIAKTPEQKQLDQKRELQRINWEVPLAVGAGAHEYQKRYLADQPKFPGDETGIKFQTAKQAMANPEQRFKPQEQYVLPSALAAEGGRIGYNRGRVVNPGGYAGDVEDFYEGRGTPEERAKKIGGTYTGILPWITGSGAALVDELDHYKYNLGLSKEETINALERQWEESIESGAHDVRGSSIGQLGIRSKEEIRDKIEEGWDMVEAPTTGTGIATVAQGGRIGYADGTEKEDSIFDKTKRLLGWGMAEDARQTILTRREKMKKALEELEGKAQGGRIGYDIGGYAGNGHLEPKIQGLIDAGLSRELAEFLAQYGISADIDDFAQGGRIGAQEGGLMNLGGMEKDYRQEGGFVPIGGQEKADDVPARLSKNEFVFTADAVRAAGGGDIDQGAEVMERLMENLEAGGKVSEESQGLEGARGMFANAQQLEKRII